MRRGPRYGASENPSTTTAGDTWIMEDAVRATLAGRNETDGADDEFREIVRRQLELIGEDPDREGLKRTPQRVATALAWLTRGYEMDVQHVVNGAVFDAEGATNMIMVRDIE